MITVIYIVKNANVTTSIIKIWTDMKSEGIEQDKLLLEWTFVLEI